MFVMEHNTNLFGGIGQTHDCPGKSEKRLSFAKLLTTCTKVAYSKVDNNYVLRA